MKRYRARSWNVGEPTDDYPGRFYMVDEVDSEIKKMKSAHAFQIRRWKALEVFYLKELNREPQ